MGGGRFCRMEAPLTWNRERRCGLLVGAVAGSKETKETGLVERIRRGAALGTPAEGLRESQ